MWWKVKNVCTGFSNNLIAPFDFMATQIILNNDIVFMKSWSKVLHNVVFKSLS